MGLCLLGRITRVTGVRGGVKIESWSDVPGRFSMLGSALIGNDENSVREIAIVKAQGQTANPVLFFEGYEDRDSARELVGMKIFIPEESMLPPPPGKHFIHDLIGCRIISPDNASHGTVKDVLSMPGQDLYVVDDGGKERLIPAVPEFIERIDTQNKCIVIRAIPGLLDDED
jgi:16S rRNA processing protein RimM